MKTKLLLAILIVFYINIKINYVSEFNMCWGNEEDLFYVVSSTGIHVPLNKLILIKKDDKVGAFKFIYFEEKKAEYEWFYPIKHGLQKDKIKRGKGKLTDLFIPVIGRIAFQLGKTEVKCGPLRVDWPGLNIVSFFDDSTPGWKSSIQLAPTNKVDINEVDPDDPQLIWYRYDENRKDIKIPLSSLGK